MELRCVLYLSTAAPGLPSGEVEVILAQSRRNNAADGISGLLLFNGSNFLQLIEGVDAVLGRLMRRLYTDPRHGSFVRLVDRPISRTVCVGWAMQPVGIGLDQPARGAAVVAGLPAGLDDDLRTMIGNFARLN